MSVRPPRWFFAHGSARRGPLPHEELLAALQREGEPGAVLVWRKGLSGWVRADALPEIAARLETPRSPGVARPPAPDASRPVEVQRGRARVLRSASIVLVTSLVLAAAWYQIARRAVPPQTSAEAHRAAGPSPVPTPAATDAAHGRRSPEGTALVPAAHESDGLATSEQELPEAERRKLRGVAAWSGTRLRLTVYNGTGWRVTELQLRVARFSGDDFAPDERPLLLVPPEEPVEAGVAEMLQRVAPDRRKPGLNAFDTGVFESPAGPPPEGYRWEIERARGYPPPR